MVWFIESNTLLVIFVFTYKKVKVSPTTGRRDDPRGPERLRPRISWRLALQGW